MSNLNQTKFNFVFLMYTWVQSKTGKAHVQSRDADILHVCTRERKFSCCVKMQVRSSYKIVI